MSLKIKKEELFPVFPFISFLHFEINVLHSKREAPKQNIVFSHEI